MGMPVMSLLQQSLSVHTHRMRYAIVLLFATLATAQIADWNGLAQADFGAGRLRSAKKAFRRAVDQHDGQPREQAVALAGLGQTMLALGEWSNARRTLEQALALAPGAPQIWHLLGQARLRTGDRTGAEAAIHRGLALADSPEIEAACRADLATQFGKSGALGKGALQQAINTVLPGQARARMLANLGILQWKDGSRSQAAETLSRALSEMEAAVGPHHPDLAFILENYATVLRKIGRKTKAHQSAQRARELKAAFAWQANTSDTIVDVKDLRAK